MLMRETQLGYEKSFMMKASGANDSVSVSPESNVKITLKVIESFPYTSTIELIQHGVCPGWVTPPTMVVRVYHDARSAEVTSYQNQKRIQGKYVYPNPQMRMPDEKAQLNQFLAEWLTHCFNHGHTEVALDFVPLR